MYLTRFGKDSYTVNKLRILKQRGIKVPDYELRKSLLTKISDLEKTVEILTRRCEIYTESGEVKDGSVSTNVVKTEETLTDVVGEDEKSVDAGFDSRGSVLRTVKSLDKFFERPVEIAQQEVPLGLSSDYQYKVWDLYTLNPSVRAKLRNYSYIKGTLNLRIAFSGTPFHYGRFLLSYQPCAERNANLSAHASALAATTSWRPLFINYLSQAEGAVTLNVNENKPVLMSCPFISTKNMHRLFGTSSTAISDVTSYPDLENAGTLYVFSINDVGSVSSTPTNVYFRIYAWMSNVELGVPTATSVAITTEAGEMDEREVGPIERFSSSAQSISSALSVVPMFEPFAVASSQIFSGIGTIASYFGWSVPVPIHEPSLVRNRGVFNGAQTIGYSSAKRATLDPKQELTVDPYACGTVHDDLALKTLCSRRSYLRTFTWSAASSSILWKCRVSPNLATTVQTGTVPKNYFSPTAMAFAAQPFRYWRGDVTFRFEFVTSNYHRGKVAIIYEPNISQEPIISTTFETNKQFVKIVDLQETQTVDFCVQWASPRTWLKCLPKQSLTLNDTDFSATTSAFGFVNGFIYVYPFTELQSPDGDGIDVNVYVHSEDMHFNQLLGEYPIDATIPTEAGEVSSSSTLPVTCMVLNETSADTNYFCSEFFGERILSFRSLLKRYQFTENLSLSGILTGRRTPRFSKLNYPRPNHDYTTSYVDDIRRSLFGYLRFAYLGVRGSVRYRVEMVPSYGIRRSDVVFVRMDLPSTTSTEPTPVDGGATTGYEQLGSVAFPIQAEPFIDYEIPYYSNNKFCFSFATDLVGTNNEEDMEEEWSRTHTLATNHYFTGTPELELFYSISTGEDFNFMRFCGAPFYREDPIV